MSHGLGVSFAMNLNFMVMLVPVFCTSTIMALMLEAVFCIDPIIASEAQTRLGEPSWGQGAQSDLTARGQ